MSLFDESLWQPLVWTDYRLAVLFTVLTPLVLLIWAFVQKNEAIQRLFVIYWRVSSLLAISVYLMIASLPIAFLSGFFARILIPVSLWFWADLNDEIDGLQKSTLKLVFKAWRWATTIYCAIGVLFQLPSLQCASMPTETVVESAMCRVWLEAPWGFQAIFHPNTSPQLLGFVGISGLTIYLLYLLYFVFIRLSRSGRSAMG
jgi:hypothetical protein